MTQHPLTKELLSARPDSPHNDETFDKIVRGYLTRRAEWLKSKTDFGADFVDEAFHLEPETLRDKFIDSISLSVLLPKLEEHGILDMFVRIAEEHFNHDKQTS